MIVYLPRIKSSSLAKVVTLATFFLITLCLMGAKHRADAASASWTGGGTDSSCGGHKDAQYKWSCAKNWSTGTVPSVGDVVSFNGSSSKNAIADVVPQNLAGVIVEGGYHGKILLKTNLTTQQFTQNGGVVDTGKSQLKGESFSINGGSFIGHGSFGPFKNITVNGGDFKPGDGTLVTSSEGTKLTCHGSIFKAVAISTGTPALALASDCALDLGDNPVVKSDVLLTDNASVTGNGILNVKGNLTLKDNAQIRGFDSLLVPDGILESSSNAIDLTSMKQAAVKDLVVKGGSMKAPRSQLEVSRNFTVSGGNFVHEGGTVLFTGTENATVICNKPDIFQRVRIAREKGELTVNSPCELPLGSSPTIMGTIHNNAIVYGSGVLKSSGGNFWLEEKGGIRGFDKVDMDSAVVVNGSDWDLGKLDSAEFNGGLFVNKGTFKAPSGKLNVKWITVAQTGKFVHNNSTVTIYGANSISYLLNTALHNLVFTGDDVRHVTTADLVVDNITYEDNVDFTNITPLTVKGNIKNKLATNLSLLGDVKLDGHAQSIEGPAMFGTLTKKVTKPDTLTFKGDSTSIVVKRLELKGNPEAVLTLKSATSGKHWKVTATERELDYLSIRDSENTDKTSYIDVRGKQVSNSGNNVYWLFTGDALPTTTMTPTPTATPTTTPTASPTQTPMPTSTPKPVQKPVKKAEKPVVKAAVVKKTTQTQAKPAVLGVTDTAKKEPETQPLTANVTKVEDTASTSPQITPTPTSYGQILKDTHVLEVKVLDDQGRPVQGARVSLNNLNITVITDKNGLSRFENIMTGTQDVEVIYRNYKEKRAVDVLKDPTVSTTFTMHNNNITWTYVLGSVAAVVTGGCFWGLRKKSTYERLS